ERVLTMTASGPSSLRTRAKMRAMSLPMKRFVSNVHLDISHGFHRGLGSDFREGEDDDIGEPAFQQAPKREPDARRAEDDRVAAGSGDAFDFGADDPEEALRLPRGHRDLVAVVGLLDGLGDLILGPRA